jgi:antitoxin (DNA-binding transcriptional repressor) of toxin-antitoxin stability system
MRKATVRDLRYSFARIARWLRRGETVEVTYRSKRLARLVPAVRTQGEAPVLPDFEARLKRLFPEPVKGRPASELILEARGDR